MLEFSVLLLAALAAPDAASAEKPRVVFMELQARNVDRDTSLTIDESLSVAFSAFDVFDVVTAADLQATMELQAAKATAGCDDNSCMAELAQALGASAVVHGALAKLDDQIVLTVSLFDAKEGRAVGREQVTGKTASEVLSQLESVAGKLTRAWTGGEEPVPSPAPVGSGPNLGLVVGGASGLVIGGAGAVVGGLMLSAAQGTLEDERSLGADKEAAGGSYTAGSAIIIAGVLVAVAGAAATAAGFVLE